MIFWCIELHKSDRRLRAVFRAAGLMLSKEKCEFSKWQIKFLSQLVDDTGHPDKLCVIKEMKSSSTVSELQRFLGMVNQLIKFSSIQGYQESFKLLPSRDTMLSADVSSYGIGAVLCQQQPNGDMRPFVYQLSL